MPPNNHSLIYLVTTAPNSVTMTLPLASMAASRFVTVTRVDNGRRVTIRPQGHDFLEGANTPLVMDDRYDSFTMVSDGHEWVVLSRRN